MRLENLTWPKAQEYFEKNDMVLISIGSIECHGRHMPLGTDTLIPNHLLEKIEKKSDVLIAPTIPYGSSPGLAPYPGSIDIDSEVLYQFCRQIFLSLYRHGARKFVFLNGHGGNIKMIQRLGMEFEDKGCLVAMLNWWLMAWDMNPAWKGGHGGGEETAANGVILITTKKGTKSGQPKLTYDGYVGVQKTGKKYDVLNSMDRLNLEWAAKANNYALLGSDEKPSHVQFGTGDKPIIPNYMTQAGAGGRQDIDPNSYSYPDNTLAPFSDTDWWDEIDRPAMMQNHQISLAGGTEKGTYNLSANYFKQDGTVIDTYYQRYQVRANTQFNVRDCRRGC